MKEILKLSNQQNELFEVEAKNANKKYYFFPKVYVKLDNNEFEAISLKDCPEGIVKYIKNQLGVE